ncbi:MAG: glycosyltransferase [Candidatus Obscuribacterales bacterium]|nr:glycosyltransferase [Candidatus Obscuribacterales bacterium]
MKVSIIIPCFNHWQYLPEALDSALNQTYSDCEVVIVDDGSTIAPSDELLKSLQHERVKFFRIENSGPSAARNQAIEKASGQLILPLDADDKIAPTYVEKALKFFLDQPDVGIVYCDAEYFGNRNQEWELPPYNFPDILLDNYIFSAALFKKDDWKRVGGYNVNMIHGWEDHDFWLSIVNLKKAVVRIPETLFFYRQVDDSRTNRFKAEQKMEMFEQIAKNHRQLFVENFDFIMHRFAELRQLLDDDTPEMEVKRELQNLKERIRQMEASGFWKLRNRWQKVKRVLKVSAKHGSKDK